MLVPNTNFNSKEAYIFVATNASFSDVKADLEPLLKDIESFEVLAKQKKNCCFIFNFNNYWI